MIKNNKGFVITEVLILSTVIIGVLTLMYTQFKNINRSYQYSFKYDTVEGLYLANNIVNYINDGNYDKLIDLLNNKQEGYLDITECNIENSNLISYCNALFQKSEIEKIIFAEENLSKLKQNMSELDNDLKEYINQIKILNDEKDYRIIIKYKNGTFATMRFNKGNRYVEEGLIIYLDGINNTGKGHSTETQTWKDLSGNGNDATLYNNPTWSNNSLTFDGIDDYGILNNTANLTFPNGLTIETRVKVLSITDFGGATYNMFIDNASSSNPRNGISQYIDKNSLAFITRIATNTNNSDGYNIIKSNTCGTYENYYTIVTTYDNNNINLYINGIKEVQMTMQSTYSASSSPFHLSKQVYLLDRYSNVEFQNVLIYDRALTENEVLRNYQVDKSRF